MSDASLSPAPTGATPPRRRRHRRRRHHRESRSPRLFVGAIGLLCLAAALGLAWQHPSGRILALLLVLLVTVAARYFWTLWPGWMLGLIPIAGLAPWTGWQVVEEFDLLVLASVAGGYFAISGPHRTRPPQPVPIWRRELRWRTLTLVLMGLAGVSAGMAVIHGLVTSGGLPSSLYVGYLEGGAAGRTGRAALALLLVLPLWQRMARRTPQTITPALGVGLGLALALTALGVVYERVVYAALTDFSSDYRVTGTFWEMHVGGAALDGMLALLLPFALLGVLRLRGRWGFVLAASLLMLGSYAVLVTFSRGLYLALGLSLPLLVLLWVHQQRRARRGAQDPASSWLPGKVLPDDEQPLLPDRVAAAWLAGLVAVAGTAAVAIFPTSGYRGLLALCGAVIALLFQPPLAGRDERQRLISSLLGLVMALPLVALAFGANWLLAKAAYGFYALYWAVGLLLARRAGQRRHPWASPMGDAVRAALWFATLGCVAVVAWSWGGDSALRACVPPVLLLCLAWPIGQQRALTQRTRGLSWRSRLGTALLLLLVASVVAALGGGAYLGNRLQRSEQDLGDRFGHWSRTLTTLSFVDGLAFGAGAGRFAPVFARNAPPDERIGDYRWNGGNRPHVWMKAGQHMLGRGEMLRLTQRIAAAPAGLVLTFKAQADEPAPLHFEVCQKHLLYETVCAFKGFTVPATDGWTSHQLAFDNPAAVNGPGLQFAMAVEARGAQVRLSDLSLRGPDGVELLRNGDLRENLQHWFPTSERHHLPWHAKNLGLHVLFEQGLVGLVLGASLYFLALGRLLLGGARDHPLAPALTAALIGFGLVGLFDSLTDATRVGFLFLLLMALSLGLRAPPPPPLPSHLKRA